MRLILSLPLDSHPMTPAVTPADAPTSSAPSSAGSSQVAIRCTNLSLGYGHKTVLSGVDLTIPPGSVTALIGPNGAGKSTLLNALAGLSRPRGGQLQIPAARQRGGVALVFQATESNARLPLTVREVVAMGRYPYHSAWGRFSSADKHAITAAMDQLGIADLASAQLHELSGGQRQRALVAQGLAQQSDVLLLDEPYTGLDILSRKTIHQAVAHESSIGRTVVLSTHDISDAAAADHVVVLAGRLVAAGPPRDVLTDETLSDAYGSRLVRLGDGPALLDDPHAHHDHEH